MGQIIKWAMRIGGGLGVVAIAALALNWGKIDRLLQVNSLFDADNIVHNFSNMDSLMFTHDHPLMGEPRVWEQALAPLPQQVSINGQKRELEPWLTEVATTALVVIHADTIVHEDYRLGTGADDLRISWSMAKSFLSALVGTAIERGEISSLDVQVTDYVPSLIGSAYEGATLRNVLNMSSGVAFNENYLDKTSDINKMGRILALGGSMDAFAQQVKTRARAPGSARKYVSIDTHVIGMVLRAATGKTVMNFMMNAYGQKWAQVPIAII